MYENINTAFDVMKEFLITGAENRTTKINNILLKFRITEVSFV